MIRRTPFAKTELTSDQIYYALKLNNGKTIYPSEDDIREMRKQNAQAVFAHPALKYGRKVAREWNTFQKALRESLSIMQLENGDDTLTIRDFEYVREAI